MINKLRFHTNKPQFQDQRGVILIAIIMIATVLTIIGLSLATTTTSQYSLASADLYTVNADMVAEAGIEQSVQQLNTTNTFTGYATAQVFFDNATQGYGTFTTTVTNSNNNSKIISSIGRVYSHNNHNKLLASKGVKVTAVGTASPGYSVVTGPGGLNLAGSANISNADVYVNGILTLSGASSIGSDAVPAHVYVANNACPTGATPGATYPKVCTTGQPIPLSDYSSVSIIGTTCATGQTQSRFPINKGGNAQIRPGNGANGGSGLVPGCIAPVGAMPTYDRAAQISAVTTTAAGTSNTYVCNSSPFNRTWPANLKLTGNVSIAGSCNVTVKGNVYITGNLTLGGAAKLTVDESAGTTRPVIITDGTISAGNSAALNENSKGTGMDLISFKSTASCSPACTSLSGNELKASQGVTTVTVGGAGNYPGMIFNAYWGKIVISGSGNVGSAAGQTIDMSGAGTVTFGTSLASGSSTWTISSYQTFTPPKP